MTETLLKFPCSFIIKIMGVNNERFIPEVTAIIASLSSSFDPETNVSVHQSKQGKYLSISATIDAQSQHQLDQIYLALNKHELVKVTL